MQRYAVIEKFVGETPLQAIREYQKSDPALVRLPLTYAGRLDPLAQGKLLVLIGEECKRRAQYDGLDKEYVFEVLLGFKTDTGDVLGIPEQSRLIMATDDQAQEVARSLVGVHTLPYPAYSSKVVDGKPLFRHSLEGSLDSITVPQKEMRVYSMRYLDKMTLSRAALIERIIDKIGLVQAHPDPAVFGSDFRKDDICTHWWSLRSKVPGSVTILRFSAIVSSGTYIRALAPVLAERLGTHGLAYSINRTRIGKYLPLTKGIGFWTRIYH